MPAEILGGTVCVGTVQMPPLPLARWSGGRGEWSYDPDRGALTVVADAGTDLIHEPLHGVRVTDAPMLLFPTSGDFALSARVSLLRADRKWAAGALVAWRSPTRWAKVCMERDHHEVPTVITVVTDGWSDDAVHSAVGAEHVWLRILRTGDSVVMHSSPDGDRWDFVRVLRLGGGPGDPVQAGFLAQCPWGGGTTVRFDRVVLSPAVPADVRDGT